MPIYFFPLIFFLSVGLCFCDCFALFVCLSVFSAPTVHFTALDVLCLPCTLNDIIYEYKSQVEITPRLHVCRL